MFNIETKQEAAWIKGRISDTAITFEAKVYENESSFGIDGGRISKLRIWDKGVVVFNYDRNEDLEEPGYSKILKKIKDYLEAI